jgi:hypothetical protein
MHRCAVKVGVMTIERLLKRRSFPPELTTRLKLAYMPTLRALQLVDQDDPIIELVANKLVEFSQTGFTDPNELARRAIGIKLRK